MFCFILFHLVLPVSPRVPIYAVPPTGVNITIILSPMALNPGLQGTCTLNTTPKSQIWQSEHILNSRDGLRHPHTSSCQKVGLSEGVGCGVGWSVCVCGGGVAAVVTNMERRVRDCKML